MWNFMGFMLKRDGYGYGTIKIAECLRQLDPQCRTLSLEDDGANPFAGADQRSWWLDGRTVALCVPDFLPQIDASDGLISYTMFEASRLPRGWAELLNRHAAAVIVPCHWNLRLFQECGVRRPIYVAKWGVDRWDYPLLPRPRTGAEPYTFLWSGTPDRRKGWDVMYRAFYRAFGHDPSVRLCLHFRALPKGVTGVRDPNVSICYGLHDLATQRAMLARADCFVFPSRGEGWGSPPREAAATGLPVIATDCSGLSEDITSWALPLRVSGPSAADYGPADWGDVGDWSEPDGDHLVELLRWCAAHRTDAAAFGRRAAAWLTGQATWVTTAVKVREVVMS